MECRHPTLWVCCLDEVWVCVKRCDHRVLVSALKLLQEGGRHRRLCRGGGHPRTTTLFVPDDGDDVCVSTFGGNRERTCRVSVRPDALASVGTVLHQETNYFRSSLQYRMVESPMLVVLRHIEMD